MTPYSNSQASYSVCGGGPSETSDMEFLAKRVGELETMVGRLKEELQMQRDINSGGWKEALNRAIEVQRVKYTEYSEEL